MGNAKESKTQEVERDSSDREGTDTGACPDQSADRGSAGLHPACSGCSLVTTRSVTSRSVMLNWLPAIPPPTHTHTQRNFSFIFLPLCFCHTTFLNKQSLPEDFCLHKSVMPALSFSLALTLSLVYSQNHWKVCSSLKMHGIRKEWGTGISIKLNRLYEQQGGDINLRKKIDFVLLPWRCCNFTHRLRIAKTPDRGRYMLFIKPM